MRRVRYERWPRPYTASTGADVAKRLHAPRSARVAAVAAGGPDDRLAAMLEAIADIRARLDDLEYQAVQWAREQGETWDQIGERLGISRQAAQSRWRRVQRRLR